MPEGRGQGAPAAASGPVQCPVCPGKRVRKARAGRRQRPSGVGDPVLPTSAQWRLVSRETRLRLQRFPNGSRRPHAGTPAGSNQKRHTEPTRGEKCPRTRPRRTAEHRCQKSTRRGRSQVPLKAAFARLSLTPPGCGGRCRPRALTSARCPWRVWQTLSADGNRARPRQQTGTASVVKSQRGDGRALRGGGRGTGAAGRAPKRRGRGEGPASQTDPAR